MGPFDSVSRTAAFDRDFKRLDGGTQTAAAQCIKDLMSNPIPAVRRVHCIDSGRPKVFSADVTPNKAYKLSFQIDGRTIILRRIGSHGAIDRLS